MMEETNNYEKWCEQWREKFLQMDQEELKKRLPELKEEGDWLTVCHFGRRLGVHKENGKIIAMEDHDPVTCYERLNVYTLFGYVSPLAHYKDDWVRFDRLKDTSPFSKAFQEGVTEPFSRMFSGHVEELSKACEKLGGKKLPWSDAGYELKAFECIPVRFLLWDGQDDFLAQVILLLDVSAMDFILGDSVVTIAAFGLERIFNLAAVPLVPWTLLIF